MKRYTGFRPFHPVFTDMYPGVSDMKNIEKNWEIPVHITAAIIAISTVLLIIYAAFTKEVTGEAPIGDLSSGEFNTGWMFSSEESSSSESVTLPLSVDGQRGCTCTLTNIIPEDVKDGLSLCVRASMSDISIYVDGQLRAFYGSESIPGHVYYLPSAYVFAPLYDSDAGKSIKLLITPKGTDILNAAVIGSSGTIWLDIILKNLPEYLISMLLIILGISSLTIYLILMRKTPGGKAIPPMGMLLVTVGFWMISESPMRQLIFSAPTYSTVFSYTSIELIGFYAASYFDGVQRKKHHRVYRVIEVIIILQLLINIVLHFSGTAEFYSTLWLSHLWMMSGAAACVICIIIDIKSGDIKEYSITCAGMSLMMLCAVIEMMRFYLVDFYTLGLILGIGLIAILFFTLLQAMRDERRASRKREAKQKELTMTTIETIANTIDAKDKYTGGHSQRVGEYAGLLAKEASGVYGFTPTDIERIIAIGKMHDIGKIGIPDRVLNKAGRHTDEEFAVMKSHVTIGEKLLSNIDNIKGLSDGIRHHHERYDGKGYPDGLKGEDIPLIARILCIVDSYDAMTTNRIYRNRLSDKEVLNEFKRCKGTQFDPVLCDIFCGMLENGVISPPGA